MAKTRPPLTRDRILDAAIRLADEGGLESVSMRKVGHALGVEAMSLYNHVANKDDLLDGMVERVIDEFELPDDGDWEHAVRRCAISAHDAGTSMRRISGLPSSRKRGLPSAFTTLPWPPSHVAWWQPLANDHWPVRR